MRWRMDPHGVQLMASAVQDTLCGLSELRNAPDRRGTRMHRFAEVRLPGRDYEEGRMPNVVDEWITSEHGDWIIGNVRHIKADAAVDIATDSVLLVIYSRVDEQFAVEHALRWA